MEKLVLPYLPEEDMFSKQVVYSHTTRFIILRHLFKTCPNYDHEIYIAINILDRLTSRVVFEPDEIRLWYEAIMSITFSSFNYSSIVFERLYPDVCLLTLEKYKRKIFTILGADLQASTIVSFVDKLNPGGFTRVRKLCKYISKSILGYTLPYDLQASIVIYVSQLILGEIPKILPSKRLFGIKPYTLLKYVKEFNRVCGLGLIISNPYLANTYIRPKPKWRYISVEFVKPKKGERISNTRNAKVYIVDKHTVIKKSTLYGEMFALAKMFQSSYISQIQSVYLYKDNIYMVLRREKETLSKQIFNPKRIKNVCLGIIEMIESDIFYLDVKSSNILITQDNRLVVSDLGITKTKLGDNLQLTNAMFTPGFSPPEVKTNSIARYDKVITWSLGIIIYHCGGKSCIVNDLPLEKVSTYIRGHSNFDLLSKLLCRYEERLNIYQLLDYLEKMPD